MAFSLSLGGAYKTVATQEQVEGLVAQGWVLASGGTADDTTALGEFPSYLEDFGAGSVNPTFRGEGLTGELQTSLGYLIKQEQPGLSKTDLDLIKTAFYNDELKSASTFVDNANNSTLVAAASTFNLSGATSATTVVLKALNASRETVLFQ